MALIGWFAPATLGGGGPMVQDTLNGRIGLQVLSAFLLLRFIMTMASYGTGTVVP